MALDLVAEMDALVAGFANEGVEYALCGGLAVAIHGHPRATMDIDVLVRGEQLDAAMRVARGLGFDVPARKMTFGLRDGRPREVQRVSKLDPETGAMLSLDLILVGTSLEEVWAQRTTVTWRERPISIVSRSGLATMKRLAGRPQDLADLAALEGTIDDDEGEPVDMSAAAVAVRLEQVRALYKLMVSLQQVTVPRSVPCRQAMIDKVNLADKLALISDVWQPRIAGQVNDCHIKLVKLAGEFIWHQHVDEDELFLVVKGRLCMRFRDQDVWLDEGELIIVPRRIEHCPYAPDECHVLLVEPVSTLNTGDVRNERTVERPALSDCEPP